MDYHRPHSRHAATLPMPGEPTTAAGSADRFTAGTEAEASPIVIRPDDYGAGSNERVLKLATVG